MEGDVETVAKVFVTQFVCRLGAPLKAHTDQGRNFESVLFAEACPLLGIAKTRTTAFHPSGNGLVENLNGTLASMIRATLYDQKDAEWDGKVPILAAAYRATVHPSTGFTPNFLMLGRETSTPVEMTCPRPSVQQDLPEYVEKLQERMAKCYSLARDKLKAAAEKAMPLS